MRGEWKVWALCGTRPEMQCRTCFRFDTGAALCACSEPDFVATTPASWTNTFYAERGEQGGMKLVAVAKEICSQCPVRKACLTYANDNAEIFGVWGGTVDKDRRNIRAGRDPWVVCRYCEARVWRTSANQVTCHRIACKEKAKALPPPVVPTCAAPGCDHPVTSRHYRARYCQCEGHPSCRKQKVRAVTSGALGT